jgi:hypothetical protein
LSNWLSPLFSFLRSAIKDFQAGSDFLFIQQTSSDMVTFATMPPDPKNLKKKALLAMKARKEVDDYGEDGFFPTGIENEVVFQEITGKTLANLHAQCMVSNRLITVNQFCSYRISRNFGLLELLDSIFGCQII